MMAGILQQLSGNPLATVIGQRIGDYFQFDLIIQITFDLMLD